jgi:hypothetical protein
MFGNCIPGVHRARLLSAAYSDEGAARNQDPSSLDKVSAMQLYAVQLRHNCCRAFDYC